MKKIALINIQHKNEPLVVGFADEYQSDQIICFLTVAQVVSIYKYPFGRKNLDCSDNYSRIEIDATVNGFLKYQNKI